MLVVRKRKTLVFSALFSKLPREVQLHLSRRSILALSIGVCVLGVVLGDPSAASVKPRRNLEGKVISCPKSPTKPLQRCKDGTGKFVRCPGGNSCRGQEHH